MSIRWSPAWAWIILTIFVIAFVVIFDIHAYLTHGRTMTGQFRIWLFNPYSGPFMFAVWVAIWVGLTYHWFLSRSTR